jgi:peptidoglycan/xylan/chitin deacetylase (PgdA/CDA1 family)
MKKRAGITLAAVFVAVFFYRAHYELPILMYHHVGNDAEKSSLNVSLETFERQMEFLKIHGYRVLPLEEAVEKIKKRSPIPPNAVVITFDDGNLDNFEKAFPVLKKMGFPATLFMITENIGRDGWLSEEDLRILDDSGVSIGSHTVHHAYLPDREEKKIVQELRESKKRLEAILGHPVSLFSYPAGGFTEAAARLVEAEGFAGAVTTNRGNGRHNPYALHRVKVTEARGGLLSFWAKTSGLYRFGKKAVETA